MTNDDVIQAAKTILSSPLSNKLSILDRQTLENMDKLGTGFAVEASVTWSPSGTQVADCDNARKFFQLGSEIVELAKTINKALA